MINTSEQFLLEHCPENYDASLMMGRPLGSATPSVH